MDRVGSMSDEEVEVEFQDSAGAEAFAAEAPEADVCVCVCRTFCSPCTRRCLGGGTAAWDLGYRRGSRGLLFAMGVEH